MRELELWRDKVNVEIIGVLKLTLVRTDSIKSSRSYPDLRKFIHTPY